MYGNDFDLVGVITGVVEKSKMITGEKIRPGYVAIGFGSNGLHTNGFSLARNIFFSQCGYTVKTYLEELGETVGEALLKPHICYYPAIRAAQDADLPLHGIAHISRAGGLYDNVPRILPDDVSVVFRTDVLPIPPVFKVLVEKGHVDPVEAYRVFNMGVGMVWFVPPKAVDQALEIARGKGFTAGVIGKVVPGHRDVRDSLMACGGGAGFASTAESGKMVDFSENSGVVEVRRSRGAFAAPEFCPCRRLFRRRGRRGGQPRGARPAAAWCFRWSARSWRATGR